jgi:hypothetical protein
MARALRSIPAVLAALLLAAHYVRAASYALAAVCVAAIVLLFFSRPWATVALRAGLAAGVLVWAATAWRIASLRMSEGRPYGRMLLILGAVAAFTAFAAWILPRPQAGRAES